MAPHAEDRSADARADGRHAVKPAGCPTDEALAAFRAAELPADAAALIARHVESCPRCGERDAAQVSRHELWVQRIREIGSRVRRRSAPAAAPRVDAIPGYRVLDELGRGGQGIVYRALQLSTRREVALKLLQPDTSASERGRQRFEREIEVAASLQHPNIVHVLDSGVLDDGVRYVVMDYIRGESLLEYVRAHGLKLGAALRLFAELCDGVNHAHQNGVIHRDLKPSNVVVDEQGRPCVLDFGLARAADPAARATLTLPGHVGGTLPYMSPELARGLPGAGDVRGDVYSLGVMLYELLAGRPPYSTDGDVLDALRNIAEMQPPAPSCAGRSASPGRSAVPSRRIDSDLDTIVLCALAKEPERRYQTAGELADELRRYLSGQPIAARRDSTWYVLRKSLRRHRAAASLAAGLFVTVCASAVALGWMYADQRRLRGRAESAAAAALRAEAQSEQRFSQLRELARVFIFELDPLIRRLPGAAHARQRIVETGLRYLDALADRAADEPALQLDLAGAYRTIGDVQGDVQSSSLEDLDAALASYAKALAMLDRVPTGDVRVERERALIENKIGQAHGNAGRVDAARAAFERAVRAADAALAANRDDSPLLDSLADAHERLANTYAAKDPERAERHYRLTMEISERIAAAAPDDLWRQRDIGVAHTKLANLLAGRGDREGALEHYRAFIEIAERLLGANPSDTIARQDVLTGHQWMGILLGELERGVEAIAAFE